eukprot:3505533-Prymnesium_polylepis.1
MCAAGRQCRCQCRQRPQNRRYSSRRRAARGQRSIAAAHRRARSIEERRRRHAEQIVARIGAAPLQRLEGVSKGWDAQSQLGREAPELSPLLKRGHPAEALHRDAQRPITLRVDSRRVERLRSVVHAQKACGLLIGLWANPLDRGERLDPLEAPARLCTTGGHDCACCLRAEADDMGEERGGRHVQVHADGIDGRLDDLFEGAGEAALVDVVLVHAHAWRGGGGNI